VISEIKNLVDNGVQEVILSGINTGAYGQDFEEYNLSKLLKELIKQVPNLRRIRVSSIELMEVSDELLDTVHQHINHFAFHLHIPLQGGCDNTLKRMNRKYTIKEYIDKIDRIKQMFPKIAITTDCLAGFVGETNEDFEETVQTIENLGFAEMHIFPYSRRKRTAADYMKGHISDSIRNERAHKLIELSRNMAMKYRCQFIGEELEVLVESKKDGKWVGRSSNYIEVVFDSEEVHENELVMIKLNNSDYPVSMGEFVRKVA
jgi:threonylcarbamoyladenosine tRNA methylthiotransferase MtaB